MIIIAKKLSKSFSSPSEVHVLKEVDLEIEKGKAVAIMGKSGEGKSTLLHILGTLEKPTSGELLLCGQSIDSVPLAPLRNHHIGFIFQSFNLLEDYTVLENILMPAKIARLPTHLHSPSYKRAQMLLEKIGLSSRANFLAKLLSGGEKQRVAIARALLNNPELILADEPSGNLDHMHSQAVHQLLLQLTKEEGKTLVVVTHDPELASLCDHTYLLKDGKLGTCKS
ncbi:MAG: ABC transporter ATP-binding protein [Parachlamydiales bacterium]|nr:ABC transporter ATP-binding protein [Verrucomicrobiota bacterium]MBX3720026.1 ABC transporter ATP-binding protein [Candidatus Acheromyda pituitae]